MAGRGLQRRASTRASNILSLPAVRLGDPTAEQLQQWEAAAASFLEQQQQHEAARAQRRAEVLRNNRALWQVSQRLQGDEYEGLSDDYPLGDYVPEVEAAYGRGGGSRGGNGGGGGSSSGTGRSYGDKLVLTERRMRAHGQIAVELRTLLAPQLASGQREVLEAFLRLKQQHVEEYLEVHGALHPGCPAPRGSVVEIRRRPVLLCGLHGAGAIQVPTYR